VVRPGALVFAAVAACGTDPIVLAPIIDSPPDGSDASAFPDLETIDLGIAIAGSPTNLVDRPFVSSSTRFHTARTSSST